MQQLDVILLGYVEYLYCLYSHGPIWHYGAYLFIVCTNDAVAS